MNQPPVFRSHRHHLMPVRIVKARPRLFLCIAFALALAVLLPWHWHPVTRALLVWNAGSILYVALVGRMIRGANMENIRRRAQMQDEGQTAILLLSLFAAIASLGAIVLQLGAVKDMHGLLKSLHIGLAALTIASAFAFIHIMFMLHYAHEFYAEWKRDPAKPKGERGGLMFPGTDTPGYVDFMYFSFVIGVASQTADVATCSKEMRVIVLIHGVVSFFFNTTVLALTINIAAGLI